MSTKIKPTFQIQRINTLENKLEQIQLRALEELTRRPNPKSWSPIEVAKHMIIAQEAYRSKLNAALSVTKTGETLNEFKASAIPSFLIKRFPPSGNQIKHKMKTMKKFQPVLEVSKLTTEEVQKILADLSASLKELKSWIDEYRIRPVSMKKFNSAIGPVVRFNIPEACEFILCHNERHFLQLENALAKQA